MPDNGEGYANAERLMKPESARLGVYGRPACRLRPLEGEAGISIRPSRTIRVPAATLLRQPLWGARYCLKILPGLNGPKPTAHEYLSFPCLLVPKNESSRICLEPST